MNVTYIANSLSQSAEASKEGNKQQAKGNVPGQDSLTDRASGALGAASDKINQEKHEGSASGKLTDLNHYSEFIIPNSS